MLATALSICGLLTVVPLVLMALRKERGKRLTLRRYAFIPILFGACLFLTVGFWHYTREVAIHDAKDQAALELGSEDRWPEVWEEEEFRDTFWAGLYENDQSEMLQLGVEGVMLIALGAWVAYKDQEQFDELNERLDKIEAKIDRALGES